MLKIAICDDDVKMTGRLDTVLEEIAKRNFVKIDTEVFLDGGELEKAVEEKMYFDIIFLDIEMGDEDGITAARKIRETDRNVLIIYVTSHESYMQESFSVRPFRFVVKPIEEKILERYFLEAYEEISSYDSYFRYKNKRKEWKIPIRKILYLESHRRKIYVVTEEETLEFYGKLSEVEEELKQGKMVFLRVHQSFLVNYRHIEGLAYDYLIMDSGKRISISEDRRRMISEQYCSMEDTFYVAE